MPSSTPSDRVRSLKAELDELVGQSRAALVEAIPAERPVLAEACDNFVAAGPELLDEATDYLWAYYRTVADEFGPEERADYEIPELGPSADVWDEVGFRFAPELLIGGGRYEPGPSYISFSGRVSWELEHGLQLVFEHGQRVCKVGPYDGHTTNGHAFGDESLTGVIFK